jgi:TonB family protein
MFEQPTVRIGGRGARWFGRASATVAIHVAVVSTAVVIAQTAPARAPRFMKSALTYIALSAPSSVPSEPSIPIVFPDMVEMAALKVATLPELDVPILEAAPDPVPLLPIPEQPAYAPKKDPVPAPKVDPVKQVAVGAFAASDVPSRTMNANKQIDRAGFDAPMAQAAPLTKTTSAVGTFDASNTAARPGTDRPVGTLTADAGFGRTAVATAQPKAAAVVATGFGDDTARLRARPTDTAVQTTGFDAQPTTSAALKPAQPAERIDIPMEVLAKPNPVYTAEARDLKLEGEVSLAVEFCASGEVRVLRVVKGLGHGLDEAAAQAAGRIRFKPAQSRGHAVDVTTTVYISFRLS